MTMDKMESIMLENNAEEVDICATKMEDDPCTVGE